MVLLLWLILFKTSFDIISVFTSVHIRNVNLVPFLGPLSGMVENFLVFIPLGLFLSIYFDKVTFWRKLIFICAFSLTLETIQYIFSIGMSDITDVITNTLGGLFGLSLYSIGKNNMDSEKMNRIIVILVALFAAIFVLLRLFVFRVKY
jgi:glycopeptide antibiotics resistance protein